MESWNASLQYKKHLSKEFYTKITKQIVCNTTFLKQKKEKLKNNIKYQER